MKRTRSPDLSDSESVPFRSPNQGRSGFLESRRCLRVVGKVAFRFPKWGSGNSNIGLLYSSGFALSPNPPLQAIVLWVDGDSAGQNRRKWPGARSRCGALYSRSVTVSLVDEAASEPLRNRMEYRKRCGKDPIALECDNAQYFFGVGTSDKDSDHQQTSFWFSQL